MSAFAFRGCGGPRPPTKNLLSGDGDIFVERDDFGLCVYFFECHGEHQFDSIELIDLACAWIVVDGGDVCLRVEFAYFFNHAFSGDVIGEAGERL